MTNPSNDGVMRYVRKHLLDMPGYEPIVPTDVVAKQLSIPESEIVKLDANENLYGPSPKAVEALARFQRYHIYPDPSQREVRAAVGRYAGADPERIVLGNGSDELLDLFARLFLSPGDTFVNFPPTFGVYHFLGDVYNANVVSIDRREDFAVDITRAERALESAKLAFVASPNNPTGNLLPPEELERLLKTGVPIAVDEAYAEFAGATSLDLQARYDNLIVIRTFSKWAGLAGLRAGYAVLPEPLVEIVWRVKVPYNLTVAAEQAILASLEDVEALRDNARRIVEERNRLFDELQALDFLRPFPSEANFILCEVKEIEARAVRDALRERGILVRYFNSPGLRNCVRISVGRPEHTDRLLAALKEIGAKVA